MKIQGFRQRRCVMVKNSDRYILLRTDEIIFITREGRATVIYTTNQVVHTNKGLKDLEKELGGYPFYRSHKGFIINLDMAKEFIPCGRTSYEVVMANTNKKPLITWDKIKQLEYPERTPEY